MTKLQTREIGISTIKSIIGAIPYIGTALNETLFEYRSRLKQDRINNFCESLSASIAKLKESDINLEQITSEAFSDLIESIIYKVSMTKSEEKRQRFKNILLNQIKEPYTGNLSETFIELTSQLNSKQIEILSGHSKIGKNISKYYKQVETLKKDLVLTKEALEKEITRFKNGKANNSSKFKLEIKTKEQLIQSKKKAIDQVLDFRNPGTYDLNETEYSLLAYDLISKGLLIDDILDLEKYQRLSILSITELGIAYLNFINE